MWKRGKQLRVFEGHTDKLRTVRFSPDGRRGLSGAEDKTLRLWTWKTGKEIAWFEGMKPSVTAGAFLRMAAGFYPPVMTGPCACWDVESGRNCTAFWGTPRRPLRRRSRPMGVRLFSGSYDKTVRLWRLPK